MVSGSNFKQASWEGFWYGLGSMTDSQPLSVSFGMVIIVFHVIRDRKSVV